MAANRSQDLRHPITLDKYSGPGARPQSTVYGKIPVNAATGEIDYSKNAISYSYYMKLNKDKHTYTRRTIDFTLQKYFVDKFFSVNGAGRTADSNTLLALLEAIEDEDLKKYFTSKMSNPVGSKNTKSGTKRKHREILSANDKYELLFKAPLQTNSDGGFVIELKPDMDSQRIAERLQVEWYTQTNVLPATAGDIIFNATKDENGLSCIFICVRGMFDANLPKERRREVNATYKIDELWDQFIKMRDSQNTNSENAVDEEKADPKPYSSQTAILSALQRGSKKQQISVGSLLATQKNNVEYGAASATDAAAGEVFSPAPLQNPLHEEDLEIRSSFSPMGQFK